MTSGQDRPDSEQVRRHLLADTVRFASQDPIDPAIPAICILCGANRLRPSTKFANSSWHLWNCLDCSTDFVFPIPTQDVLSRYYNPLNYDRFTLYRNRRHLLPRQERFKALLNRALGTARNSGILLDMGCSTGPLMSVGLRLGWEVEGMEIDPDAAKVARADTGSPVMVGAGFESVPSSRVYDLIVMSHWLEHVRDPGTQLAAARGHLTPDGKVLLRVPNADCTCAHFMREGWSWFIPPIHLSYFTRTSIIESARRFGYSRVETWTWQGEADPIAVELGIASARLALHRPSGPLELRARTGLDGPPQPSPRAQLLNRVARELGGGLRYANPFAPLENGELVAIMSK